VGIDCPLATLERYRSAFASLPRGVVELKVASSVSFGVEHAGPQLELKPAPAVAVLREPVFLGSCLPLTMQVATACRKLLRDRLATLPRQWPYEDRVLAVLAPSLLEDIARFHRADGPDMRTLFRSHLLEHMDA